VTAGESLNLWARSAIPTVRYLSAIVAMYINRIGNIAQINKKIKIALSFMDR
jgi:hypothetical protein